MLFRYAHAQGRSAHAKLTACDTAVPAECKSAGDGAAEVWRLSSSEQSRDAYGRRYLVELFAQNNLPGAAHCSSRFHFVAVEKVFI
jgi:hypothetical protein